MSATQIKLEGLASWSAPKKVETRNGPRNLRTAPATDSFWNAWRSGKETLKAAGISVGKNRQGNWEVCWWTPLDDAQRGQIEKATAASRATDAEVDLPCPEGLSYLPYQKAGIAYAMAKPNVLIGDEMGLGKTIQAIGVYNTDPTIHRVLVVCPSSLRLNWKKEWAKWATRTSRIAVVNGGKPSDWIAADAATCPVVVINYDILAKHRAAIDAITWDLLIVDEAHYLKNPKAIRTKAVLGQRVKGIEKAKAIAARRRIFLTGTPIVNRPVELFPLVEALDPAGLGKNFFAFAKRFCNATQTKWGWDFSGASRLDELQRTLRERFLVRRLKADVLTELPPKRRQVIEIPANGASGAVAAERATYERHEAALAELDAQIAEAEIAAAYDL